VRNEVRRQKQSLSIELRSQVEAEVDRQMAQAKAAWSRREAELRAEVTELRHQVTRRTRRSTDLEFSTGMIVGTGQRYDRTLTPAPWATLTAEITELAGGQSPEWRMFQAFRTLLDHETRGLGRIAGSTYNVVGKLTVPLFLEPPDGPVLEIGTLFGLFAPALVKQFKQVGQFRTLTVIDPLAGHQVQPEHKLTYDPTGTPVTAQVARYNFAVTGLDEDEVRLIEGFSTDEQVRTQAADRQYSVIVVDGDHSEDGVYADLWWVETVAAPGAIVIMDDFGDPGWLGVERATRRYLADGGRLEMLGTAATSAYLRMSAA
jgi:predicted O-methyltransferase YrrM